MPDDMKLYWADLHNHNSVGYAKGSLERSYDIAKRHLDVFAFTAHSRWHDLPTMPQNKHLKWVKGFEGVKKAWPQVQKLAAAHHKPGEFVTFVAFEWHSSRFGDYCLIYPGNQPSPMKVFDHVRDLQAYAKQVGALIIPHHPAYLAGWRGAAFEHLDTSVSPVLEIFSEHGGAEHDRGPHRYLRHSMGGRWTPNTLRSLLAKGTRIGVTAGTDDHLGYPGAYREGLTGIYAKQLTREGVFEALRARRCYAVTGDRIELDARVNGCWMGQALPAAAKREVTIRARGWGEIDRLELIKNGRTIARSFPLDQSLPADPWAEPVLCRVEFGWGPWGDLNMARICDWEFDIALSGGTIVDKQGCFRSGPFDENRRNIVTPVSNKALHVRSYTSRMQPLGDLVTNAVVLRLDAKPDATLKITMTEPTAKTITLKLADLAESGHVEFTGPFSSESMLVHRLVFAPHERADMTFVDQPDARECVAGEPIDDWYMARVTQSNGDRAWSSPIWVAS